MEMKKSIGVYFLLLGAIIQTSQSQIRVVKLDEAGEGRAPSEPSVAISVHDIDNIVVAAAIDKYYVTFDGGETWTNEKITSTYGVWGDPVMINDMNGHFYYFHLSDPTGNNWESEEILDRIVVQKSKDGGKTWDGGNFMGKNRPKDQDKEWAVVNPFNNHIYVTWTQFDKYGSSDPNDKSNIMFAMSPNGNKWSKAIRINKESGDCVDSDMTTQGAVPAVGMQGQVYVSWAYNEKIYFDRSYDEGKSWLNTDLVIADQPGGWDMDIPGINRCNGMPVLVSDISAFGFRGSLYVVWADQRNGADDTDIWISKSISNGDMWSSPKRINDDPIGKHQFFPWVSIDQFNGNLYIVYYDRRNYDDLQTDVYLAFSSDGGNSFKNIKISDSPFVPDANIFFGDYTNIASIAGRIVPVWTRMDNGVTSIMAAIISQEDLGMKPSRKLETGKKKKKRKGKKK